MAWGGKRTISLPLARGEGVGGKLSVELGAHVGNGRLDRGLVELGLSLADKQEAGDQLGGVEDHVG